MLDEKQLAGGVYGGVRDLKARPSSPANTAANGLILPLAAPLPALGGEGQARTASRPSQPWGWPAWIASVVIMSTVISLARDSSFSFSFFSSLVPTVEDVAVPRHDEMTSHRLTASSVAMQGAYSTATRAVERSATELARRQGVCGAGAGAGRDYNVPLHVGALVIILAVSGFACGLPMLATKFPILRIPKAFFFAVRHFGTGVLLATAFVHLLPTAFISLGDPCLSNFWTTDYPPMPGAIALFGIFFVTVIEMVFSPARQFTPRTPRSRDGNGSGHDQGQEHERKEPGMMIGHCGHQDVVAAVTRTARPADDNQEQIAAVPTANDPAFSRRSSSDDDDDIEDAPAVVGHHILTPEQQHKKSILQCMLLEVGILFHSVFIGMALSIAVGGDFVVLLIAVAFHQMFEGLALGARISSIAWPEGSWQPWLMVLAYGCTTPVGQAIGLATHTLYAADSEFGLILVGTMNAISSGLLVFASLVELLAEDFLSDHSWVVMQGRKRVFACLLVLLGAILMSLVGAWA